MYRADRLRSSRAVDSVRRDGLFQTGVSVLGIIGILYAFGCMAPGNSGLGYYLTVGTIGNGTVSPGSGRRDGGEEVVLAATPDPGWRFVEWYGQGTASGDTYTITMDNNQTVTAVFEEEDAEYTLTVNVQGSGKVTPNGGKYKDGAKVTLTPEANPGWQFDHWEGEVKGNVVTMDKDQTVTAVFSNIAGHSLTIKTVGGGRAERIGGEPPDAHGFYKDGDRVQLKATKDAGSDYEFHHWEGDLTGKTNPDWVTMDGDKTVWAIFELKTVTLTITQTQGGTVSATPVGDPPGTYVIDTFVRVTAVPDNGWKFNGWQGALAGQGGTSPGLTMDTDKAVNAVFVQEPVVRYTLTVSIVNPAGGTVTPMSGTYDEGTSVTLKATRTPGWRFVGYSGDEASSFDELSFTMNADKNITATFTPIQVNLTVNVTGQGSVDPNSGLYDAGSAVTLTPTPEAGWQFDHWEGDLTGNDDPAVITMNNHMTITAVFVEAGQTAIAWRAVYDMVFDAEDTGGYSISHVTLCGDGTKLAVALYSGSETPPRKVVVMNVDGSNQTTYVPTNDHGITALTMSKDGSRTFVAKKWELFKLEGGTTTELEAVGDFSWPWWHTGPQSIQATEDGQTVYFWTGRDVWKISHDGTGLANVIDDAAYRVSDFSVSGDGSVVAFLAGVEAKDREIHVLNAGTFSQLTSDGDTDTKTRVIISRDGSTIVYDSWNANDVYRAIDADGSNPRDICKADHNFGGWDLTRDGSKMFYNDMSGNNGRLVNTDGSGVFNVMPENLLTVFGFARISADGSRVCFTRHSGYYLDQVYVGYLNQTGVVPGQPVINSVSYGPPTAPKNAAGTPILSVIDLTAPQGVSETSVRELSNGQRASGTWPLAVWSGPRDDGDGPDVTAGDGIYTVEYRTESTASDYDELTVRFGVKDTANTVTVVDTVVPFEE